VTRSDFTLSFKRAILALRTELAYPADRRWAPIDFFVDRGVLSEIINVYPRVWACALRGDQLRNDRRHRLLRRKSPLESRMPLRVFRLLLCLARGEHTEAAALEELKAFYKK
jgi:hypothetical protein